ncbi:MAG: glycerol-3-phosphate 1-O-acyltransferase PlsY [Clostridiales bacterium]|nr:glycerol-3-phosphate 1-O-acyltransferase PlsY [Clostridiales bacterium]
MSISQYLVIALFAYLIGSISSGIIISSFKGRDVRNEGSKSAGATNVTRVLGLSYGMLTFLGDFVKAGLALLIGWLFVKTPGAMVASVFCVIGHNWPVYYHFKGGKGIVCSVAVVILLCPPEGLIAGAAALLIIWLTRFVSLGSLLFLVVSTMTLFIFRGPYPYGWWAVILLIMGVFQHRSNIARLMNGTENKFSPKRNTP